MKYIYLILLLLMPTSVIYIHALEENKTDDLTVNVLQIKKSPSIENICTFTSLQSDDFIHIAITHSGNIHHIYVKEGDYVEKGQLLLELDNHMDTLNYQQAQADYQERLRLYHESETLYKKNIISLTELQTKKYLLDKQHIQLMNYNKTLEETKIYAPKSGYIHQILVKKGENVVTGHTCFTLDSEENFYITLSLPQNYTKKINTIKQIQLDNMLGDTFSATLNLNHLHFNNNTVEIKAIVQNHDALLKKGLLLKNIISFSLPENITIPLHALRYNKKEGYVFIIENNEIKKKYVTLGKRQLSNIEILDGLEEGTLLVTSKINKIKENQTVQYHITN